MNINDYGFVFVFSEGSTFSFFDCRNVSDFNIDWGKFKLGYFYIKKNGRVLVDLKIEKHIDVEYNWYIDISHTLPAYKIIPGEHLYPKIYKDKTIWSAKGTISKNNLKEFVETKMIEIKNRIQELHNEDIYI